MNIFITGATGFLGRQTVASLYGRGHSITAWVRNENRARNLLGEGIRTVPTRITDQELNAEIENADVVINLSGEPIARIRWSNRIKQRLRDSRVSITNKLVDAINQAKSPPKLFISGSAIGFYGSNHTAELTEDYTAGEGYLANLCEEWENAALQVSKNSTRVCILRIGIIIGREGGFLQAMAQSFEYGIGTYISSNPYISWIHITDMVKIINFCIDNEHVSGPINCSSPKPISSKDFGIAMKQTTNSIFLFPIPKIILRLVLGEASVVLLQSQYTLPAKLMKCGFEFGYENIPEALDEELSYKYATISKYRPTPSETDEFMVPYKVDENGVYELNADISLKADTDTIFSFFSSALNLGLLTPSWIDFRILEIPEEIDTGSKIAYRIGLWFIGLNWITRIVVWKPKRLFVDLQEKGPYSLWWHEHILEERDDGSIVMKDRVIYRVPLGIIGRIVHKLFIRKTLLRVFNFRRKVILARFNQ